MIESALRLGRNNGPCRVQEWQQCRPNAVAKQAQQAPLLACLARQPQHHGYVGMPACKKSQNASIDGHGQACREVGTNSKRRNTRTTLNIRFTNCSVPISCPFSRVSHPPMSTFNGKSCKHVAPVTLSPRYMVRGKREDRPAAQPMRFWLADKARTSCWSINRSKKPVRFTH